MESVNDASYDGLAGFTCHNKPKPLSRRESNSGVKNMVKGTVKLRNCAAVESLEGKAGEVAETTTLYT